MGTKNPRPVLTAGLPYPVVVRGPLWQRVPDALWHQFRFALYANEVERLHETPVLRLQQSLPYLAGKKLTLSFALATQAMPPAVTRASARGGAPGPGHWTRDP